MENLSFKTLLEKYKIVIPMLQRDYAYGRAREKEKRDNFLDNLLSYFDAATPHELDFIYGSVDNDGNLILLDGQQRVTTLFLLHWYLSLVRDLNGNSNYQNFREMLRYDSNIRFSYKTRYSSTDFCNALVKLEFGGVSQVSDFEMAVNDREIIISEQIKKAKWFLPHWNYDPTIISMLNMIDSIKEHFDAAICADYYSKLVNEQKIRFNFLNLEEFNLTDELYIKMNSRGRALTRFENLKSIILKLYDEAAECDRSKSQLKKINESFGSGHCYKSVRDYAARMFDTQWTDIFWNKWVEQSNVDGGGPKADDMMLSFIAVVGIFGHILFRLDGKLSLGRTDKITGEINALMTAKDAIKGITISYKTFIELLKENNFELLFDLIDYLNIFNDNGKLKKYLPANAGSFDENDVFKCLSSDYKNKMEYERKIKAFAYIRYLQKYQNPDVAHLNAWMRFVCNVCASSYAIPNRTDTFCSALAGINYLLEEDIVSALVYGSPAKDLTALSVLDVSQIREEILKMKLSSDKDWKSALIDAESSLSYFGGRLSYLLVECCDIQYDASDEEIENILSDKSNLDNFKKYVHKIGALFPTEQGAVSNKLVPAMLSMGDYMMYFESNNTLLKNADRDNSWRRFLKEKPCGNNFYHVYSFDSNIDARSYFKAILDDNLFDNTNVDESLDKIIDSRKKVLMPRWRRLIIDNYDKLIKNDIFDWGVDRYIRWNTDIPQYVHKHNTEDNFEIDLMRGKAINGYHAELFSLCKYFELRESGKISGIEYCGTTTRSEQSYIKLTYGDNIVVKILYQDDNCFMIVDSEGRMLYTGISYNDLEDVLTEIIK